MTDAQYDEKVEDDMDNYQGENETIVIMDLVRGEANDRQVSSIVLL